MAEAARSKECTAATSPEFAVLYSQVVDLQGQLLTCHINEVRKLRQSLSDSRPKCPGTYSVTPWSTSALQPSKSPLEDAIACAACKNSTGGTGALTLTAGKPATKRSSSDEASRCNSNKASTPMSEVATAPATGEVDELLSMEDVVLMEREPIEEAGYHPFHAPVTGQCAVCEATVYECRSNYAEAEDSRAVADDQESLGFYNERAAPTEGSMLRAESPEAHTEDGAMVNDQESRSSSKHWAVKPSEATSKPACPADTSRTTMTCSGTKWRNTWKSLHVTNNENQISKSSTYIDGLVGRAPGVNPSGSQLEVLLNGPTIEMIFASALVVNACFMGLEYQCAGTDTGMQIQFYDDSGAACSKTVASLLNITEFIFGCVFTLEACFKLVGQKWRFLLDVWNWLIVVIVVSWLIATVGEVILPVPPRVMRLLRLARLMRLLRLARQIQGLDAVFLITTAIKGSVSVLTWAMALLLSVQLLLALFLNQVLHEAYFSNEARPLEERQEVYEYFGTVTRSLMSMFELTLANWPPIARLLAERVSEWFMLFSVLHKLAIGFAVVGVINGVFMQETFKAAATDDRIMVTNKEKAIKVHANKMKLLFQQAQQADTSRKGQVGLTAFREVMANDSVRMWLASMELDASDADKLFHLLDDGDGCLTADELVKGVARLKGHARSIDLATLMLDQKKTHMLLRKLLEHRQV